MEEPATLQFRYRAFISYSHADEEWAKWLHRALETYRIPKRLVGKETSFGPVPERIAPVFRDRDELATATSLGEILTAALEQSACQVVICSRRSAKSHWVNEEIKTFKRLGKAHRIFAVIVDGEPHASAHAATADDECFPPALIFRMGADGHLTDEPTEPIAADLRPGKDGKLDVKLKLVAGMVGVGLDELKQREANRRHRQALYLTAASVAGMAITTTLAGAAWIARNDAERQRIRAESEAETARQTTRFMLDLFKVSDPSEALGNTITAREILDKGAQRIDQELAAQPAIQATLMDTMGTVYTSLGLYDSAAPLVRKAYERRREILGPRHEDTAASLSHLGEVLTLRAEYEEAERSLSEALEIRRAAFGPESKPVADTLLIYADLLQARGDHGQGEKFIREALAIQRKLHGAKPHAEVAQSLEMLGLNYFDRGEYDEALQNLREAAAMQKDLHAGRPHPAYARSIDNMAFVLMETGQFEEAEPLVRLALPMKRTLYGDVHPETSASLNNLAYVLESTRKFDEAEAAYRESLTIARQLLGDRHPSIAVTLLNIAFIDFARGEVRRAIRTARESYEMTREVLGPENPDTAARAHSLGYMLFEAGEYAEAGRLLDEAVAVRRKALGERHPAVGASLGLKALVALQTGKNEQAYALAEEARTLTTEGLPPGSWQIALALVVEGAALMRMGRYAEAEPLMIAGQRDLPKAPLPYLADKAQLRLIELYHRWGKPEEVQKLRAAM